ncbi:MAG TPA: carbon-nitrogen hydrolase family protein [Anaerolineales bacterium]|nr:carbon-nitrogen hydrolase family protein [Anaerolineales bacterium]
MPLFAAVQMEAIPGDPEANLRRVIERLQEAAGHGANVVVFPECVLTGYVLSAEEAEDLAEPIPGRRTQRLAEVCQASGCLACVGTLEREATGQLFNAAALVGPSGLLARYRKTHLPCLGVDRYLAEGGSLVDPHPTTAGKLGMLICYDLRFPEPIRVLALRGAEAVLLCTAWPDRAALYPEFTARARAEENHVYLVAANRVGEERGVRYLGRSVIVAPDGKVLAEGSPDREQILYAEVDLEISRQKRIVFKPGEYELDLFADRRPELYAELSAERERGEAQSR